MVSNQQEALQNNRNMFWNLVASLVNAGEAVVVIMLVSRINTIEEAGILTISFTLANLFMNFGKYGLKNYQVAHDGFDVSFQNFLRTRRITVSGMIMIVAGYLFYNVITAHYSLFKGVVIGGVCVWYAIDAYEDGYIANMQARGRLDIGNKIFITRWSITLTTFAVADVITQNIVLAVLGADAAAIIVEMICIGIVTKKIGFPTIDSKKNVKNLLIENLPLCISEILYFFMANISKYVIDDALDDRTQAIYGYIAMPVFMISLLNSIIYQPQLMGYIIDLRENRIDSFERKLIRQVFIILGILGICLVGAGLIGIQALSMIYNIDLSLYRAEMLILLIGGAFLAVGGFLDTVMVVIGKRKTVMMLYLCVVSVGVVVTNLLVRQYDIMGAVWAYLFTMILMASSFSIVMFGIVRKMIKEGK